MHNEHVHCTSELCTLHPKCVFSARIITAHIILVLQHARQTEITQVFICCILSFGWFLGIWILCGDISKHCLFHHHRWWRWNRWSVLKLRHIKFRCWGITWTKECNIQKMAKVWNKEVHIWLTMRPQHLRIILSPEKVSKNELNCSQISFQDGVRVFVSY
jgi:hypothetical protein